MARGLWFSVVFCGVILGILTGLIVCNVTVPGDMEMVNWAVSQRNESLTFLVESLTFVSSSIPGLLITIGVTLVEVWRRKCLEWRAGWATFAYLGAVACNIGLRILVGRQRPAVSYIPHVLPELQASFQRFCYPSGHAGAVLVAFGSLIVVAWAVSRLRGVVLVGSVLLIAGAGYGRVYMGVHWPTDVLAGYLLGASWLAIGLLVRQCKYPGPIVFFLSICLSLAACNPAPAPTEFPTAEPDATETVVGDLGWRKVQGVVYAEKMAPDHEMAGALVTCSQTSYFPREASCAPYEITTGADGTFTFDVFVHDTDGINISAQKSGYKSTKFNMGGIACAGGCSSIGLLLVAEVDNPTSRIVLENHTDEHRAGAIFVKGSYAYLTYWTELAVLNVSDPGMPSLIGNLSLSETLSYAAEDSYVAGDYAYLTGGRDGVHVVDVSDPTLPVVLNIQNPPSPIAHQVVVEGDYAYIRSEKHLEVINISNPNNPTQVETYEPPVRTVKGGSFYSISGGDLMDIAGNYLYLVGRDLRILDIADPTALSQIGVYDLPINLADETASDVTVAGDYAYIAAGFTGLHIVNVSNPTAPVGVGIYDGLGFAQQVAVSGDYAYVTDAYGRVGAIDISDPAAPVEVGIYDALEEGGGFRRDMFVQSREGFDDVAAVGDYIYAVDSSEGLFIFRLTAFPVHTRQLRLTSP